MKKIKIAFGKILYKLIGKHMPLSYARISFGSRRFRAFCGKLIMESCGRNVNIEKGASFAEFTSLGDNSGIGINCEVASAKIGKNVMMGPECIILSQNHNFSRTDIPMCEQGYQETKPVTIGDDVWIGTRVIILPGVTVGDGSIIGAGSIVTKNVEPYTIVAGNPATKIGDRKNENTFSDR